MNVTEAEQETEATAGTPAEIHRLVYADLIPKDRIEDAFASVDPRSDVDVWRAFATSTLLPLFIGLVATAIGLAVAASAGESIGASALAFAAGGLCAALAGVIVRGKKTAVPAILAIAAVVVSFVANEVLRISFVRRNDEEVFILVTVFIGVMVVWGLRRTSALPGVPGSPGTLPLFLSRDAVAFVSTSFHPPTIKKVAAALIWLVGVPAGLALFVALMDERDLGVAQLVLGVALFVVGALVSRSKRPLYLARHAGILAFLLGTLCILGALLEHINIDRDWRGFLALPVLLIGWLAVRSWPVRAFWGVALGVTTLMAFDLAGGGPTLVERSDDVAFVVVAAIATHLLTRGRRYVRPVGVALALMLLVLSAVEVRGFGLAGSSLAFGTFTSLGVTACAMFAALRVLREASRAARAVVCALFFLGGAVLLIDAPALLTCALALLLGRHARVRSLELAAFAALFIAAYGLVDKPWAVLADKAIAVAIGALIVLGFGLVLRKLPTSAAVATTELPSASGGATTSSATPS